MSMADMTKSRRQRGGIGETLRTIVIAVLIALGVRTFLYEPFNIPSGSMIPTLLVGDYLFVSKFSYGYSHHTVAFGSGLFEGRILGSTPERGDVVVFRLPRDPSTDYIKRLIGLPGDRIQMIDGRLFINGEIVGREPLAPANDRFGNPTIPRYIETLPNGVRHVVMEIHGDSGNTDDTEEFVVPPEHFFFMGDNRDDSLDSRTPHVGYVPEENLVGRAEVIWFSLEDASFWEVWKWPFAIRLDRMFTVIH